MAVLNRVLNFLIFVLAIVALIYGLLLFQRRDELQQRGDKLADAVASVAKELDTNSGTPYAKSLHVDENLIQNDKGEPVKGGALGSHHFHALRDEQTKAFPEFDRMMEDFRTQAREIREQRDVLGKSIVEMAAILEKEDLDQVAFTTVPKQAYEEPISEVKKYLEAIHERDNTVFSKVEEVAISINHPMDKDALKNLDTYRTPLDEHVTHVKNLYTRAGNYADTLGQIVSAIDEHEFQVDPDRIKQEDMYTGELETILKDYGRINESLKDWKDTKKELKDTKKRLEEHITALEDANENIARLEAKVANVQGDLDVCNKKLAICLRDPTNNPTVSNKKAKVVKVNYDWNHFIIDVGAKDEIPPNVEVTVSREREFICKGRVRDVYNDYSVVEISPNFRLGTVVEGDNVIF